MSAPIPEPPLHLFIAGIVAIGMSCVFLLDEAQQEETTVTHSMCCCYNVSDYLCESRTNL